MNLGKSKSKTLPCTYWSFPNLGLISLPESPNYPLEVAELGFYWKVWNKIQDVTYSRGCRNSHYDLEDFLLLLLVNRCLSISQYINDSATLKEKEHTHTHLYAVFPWTTNFYFVFPQYKSHLEYIVQEEPLWKVFLISMTIFLLLPCCKSKKHSYFQIFSKVS